jgi:hypothetical protein
MLSGVLDYYDNQHLFRINKEVFECDGSQEGAVIDMITLESVIPLDTHIDYLSLDTEGGEALILENILKIFTPDVISVEVNYQADFDKLQQITKEKYNIVKQLGCDLILKLK